MRESAKYGINIPNDVIEDIKARRLVISEVVRGALHLTKLEPKYLYEVSNTREDSLYYTIVDSLSETKVIKEMLRLDHYSTNSKVGGIGEYDIRLVGCFPKMSDAILLRELLINAGLDKGCYVVNEFGYIRYVHLALELPRIKKLIKTDVDLSILVTEVIDLLNSSEGSDLIDRLDRGRNKVSKLINKRIKI